MNECFNPCFNGFFFSIQLLRQAQILILKVSILVLMDSSFQSKNAYQGLGSLGVSILVLMDSSFQSEQFILPQNHMTRFNPCFNGFFFSI